jgi:beta-ribofuranosylaminobenzene 5'-phosphate synthase
LGSTANAMPDSITVTIPARLHLGFLDLNGSLGRRFGSIGLAITGLRTKVAFRRAPDNRVTGPEHERVLSHVEKMAQRLAVEGLASERPASEGLASEGLAIGGGHAVDILDVVPAHAGLGSGTQLALAVAAGIRRLHGRSLDIQGDALYLGRGARSGAGMGLFHSGGLVVDGGSAKNGLPAPIVSRLHFPDHWRIIVVLDPERRGIHGSEETDAFTQLPPFSDSDAGRLCRLVIMKMLPAVVEEDIVSFGSAITEIQSCVGGYFAPAQGGSAFTSPGVAAVLAAMASEGAVGIGQSSWGPTGFAFATSDDEAGRLASIARAHPRGQDLDIRVCAGFNRAAEIAVNQADAGVQ